VFRDGLVAIVEAQHSPPGILAIPTGRELGHRVAFLTNCPERYADLPNGDLLDGDGVEVITADTNSPAGLLSAVEPLHRGGDLLGMYTNCDYNLPIVATVASQLGLPGLAPGAAALARNKLLARRTWAAAGVPVPRFVHARTLAQALDAAREIGLPCVVKPMTESASNGVRLCGSLDEVATHFGTIAAEPLDARGQLRTPGALVEEYLLGYEVSVETVTWKGVTTVLGVTDQVLGAHPHFTEIADMFPSILPEPATLALARAATDALAAIGHDFGPAHTEVTMTAEGPRVIEVNSRLAGGQIPANVEAALGVAYRREVLRMHLGEEPDLRPTRRAGAATRHLTSPRTGVLAAVGGLDLARRAPGIADVAVYLAAGAQVRPAMSNHDRYGHVRAVGRTSAEAARCAEAAANQISFVLS